MRRNVAFGDDQDAALPENYFGERVAGSYDEQHADEFDPSVVDPAVDFLGRFAGHGAALELGIGTGRIALPLAKRAFRCTGSSSRRRWSTGCAQSREARRGRVAGRARTVACGAHNPGCFRLHHGHHVGPTAQLSNLFVAYYARKNQ
jgi:hypothetical protein